MLGFHREQKTTDSHRVASSMSANGRMQMQLRPSTGQGSIGQQQPVSQQGTLSPAQASKTQVALRPFTQYSAPQVLQQQQPPFSIGRDEQQKILAERRQELIGIIQKARDAAMLVPSSSSAHVGHEQDPQEQQQMPQFTQVVPTIHAQHVQGHQSPAVQLDQLAALTARMDSMQSSLQIKDDEIAALTKRIETLREDAVRDRVDEGAVQNEHGDALTKMAEQVTLMCTSVSELSSRQAAFDNVHPKLVAVTDMMHQFAETIATIESRQQATPVIASATAGAATSGREEEQVTGAGDGNVQAVDDLTESLAHLTQYTTYLADSLDKKTGDLQARSHSLAASFGSLTERVDNLSQQMERRLTESMSSQSWFRGVVQVDHLPLYLDANLLTQATGDVTSVTRGSSVLMYQPMKVVDEATGKRRQLTSVVCRLLVDSDKAEMAEFFLPIYGLLSWITNHGAADIASDEMMVRQDISDEAAVPFVSNYTL